MAVNQFPSDAIAYTAVAHVSAAASHSGQWMFEVYASELLEMAFVVALICFLYTQLEVRDVKASVIRDRCMERFTLCLVIALAFHVSPVMLAIAFSGSLSVIAVHKQAVQKIPAQLVHPSRRSRTGPSDATAGQRKTPTMQSPAPNNSHTAATTAYPHVPDAVSTVDMILKILKTTPADAALAKKIEGMANDCIIPLIPEARVDAIAFGNLNMLAECGAQPEIELMLTCDPEVLATRLREHFLTCPGPRETSLQSLSPLPLLIKTATRTLSGHLKFVRYWRTQLNSPECKTVHFVPYELGLAKHPIYVHFSINSPYAVRMNKLFSQESPRRVELMLFVRQWARERAVSNVSRGQFSQYTWCILALHFSRYQVDSGTSEKSVYDCFHAFVIYYADLFARDVAPSICFASDGQTARGTKPFPYIEDALEPGHDLAALADAEGMERVNEELQRACRILSRKTGQAVAELMERWTKPKVSGST